MLSFTARGAVRTPETLQIRVGSGAGGALRTGAGRPSRALTPAEVERNVHAFTVGRQTTRTRPCTRLVLSECGDVDLLAVVHGARELGIAHVTVHGPARADLLSEADRLVLRLLEPVDLEHLPDHPAVSLVIPLVPEVVGLLHTVGEVAARRRPDEVVFAWPFPAPSVVVRPVEEVLAEVRPVLSGLLEQGVRARLGGLPACLGGPEPRHDGFRTRNRFYVDADHQGEAARLFFPDLVELAKPDTCRGCRVTAWCDGVARHWLDEGKLGVLQPIAHRSPER